MKKEDLILEATKVIGTYKFNTYETNYAGKVGTAILTQKNNVFTGISINLACGLGSCAENAAISEMLKNRETIIKMIVSVYEGGRILPPCGKCRELIYQIDNRNLYADIILSDDRIVQLKDLLPERWN